MKGGFIGVDVFFVISGYLISTILFENLDRGTFSFTEFYSRRIRRIFPALILVLVACFVFGWVALLADEYKQLGKYIAAGSGFVSNLLLWADSGYFDNSAETKPLLHLWSLGIEEQFYIVWPLLLWFAWKKRSLLTMTICVTAVSLTLNLWGIKQDAVATFYSPQTRFWELLAGSILAYFTLYQKDAYKSTKLKIDNWLAAIIYVQKTQSNGATLANVLSVTGLILLALGLAVINKDSAFPGGLALIPVAASILIIMAGPKAIVNRLILSNKIAVWIGLISFPLYLWHWPLLSFATIIEGDTPRREIRIGLVLLSFFLAWVTYRLIERPFRLGGKNGIKTSILITLVATIGYIGYQTDNHNGFPFRPEPYISKINGEIGNEAFFSYLSETYFPCTHKRILATSLKFGEITRCFQSKNSESIDLIIIGDSHAEHIFPAIASALPEANVAYYARIGLPFLDNKNFSDVFDAVIKETHTKKVILSGIWSRDFQKYSTLNSPENQLDTVMKFLGKHKKVYIVDNVPFYAHSPARCSILRKFSSAQQCEIDKSIVEQNSSVFRLELKKALDKNNDVSFFSIEKFFCNEISCSMKNSEFLLYRDNRHLNIQGSTYLGEKIKAEQLLR
jgi:peptidoglycan/LPS O-acetylase OafA/YrhL